MLSERSETASAMHRSVAAWQALKLTLPAASVWCWSILCRLASV
jgi:hypothetical protein